MNLSLIDIVKTFVEKSRKRSNPNFNLTDKEMEEIIVYLIDNLDEVSTIKYLKEYIENVYKMEI